MNLCIYCKHCTNNVPPRCSHPNLGLSPVDGVPRTLACELARTLPERCDAEGKWFEPAS